VSINEHGEWASYYGGRPRGIPSPVEQNRRHIAVLEDVIKLGHVKLPRRLVAIKPTFKNIVLVSPSGVITRPRRKLPELDAGVKVDQSRTYLLKRDFPDHQILKFVSADTRADFAQQLVALHQPETRDWQAGFGIPPLPSPPPKRDEPARRPWTVKYDGPCSKCGRVLAHGTEAVWVPRERRMLCLECAAA